MTLFKKKGGGGRDLNLGYPTWFSLPDWAVKTIMPFPQDYQKVILHALVGFEEAQNKPDDRGSGLKVIP